MQAALSPHVDPWSRDEIRNGQLVATHVGRKCTLHAVARVSESGNGSGLWDGGQGNRYCIGVEKDVGHENLLPVIACDHISFDSRP